MAGMGFLKGFLLVALRGDDDRKKVVHVPTSKPGLCTMPNKAAKEIGRDGRWMDELVRSSEQVVRLLALKANLVLGAP